MPETRRSTCPFDCPDACGLVVETDGRSVRSVRGDPEHGYTRGTLCPKVNGFEKTVHAPGRLLHPLIRTGAKGQGAFRRASWDEAVGLVTERWQSLIATHGRECLLPVTYAGTMGLIQRNAQDPLMHRLGASLLDRTICTSAQNAGWEQVMGRTPGSDPEDAVHSDLLFLWGINALATNIHFLTQVKAVRRAGGRVFLVDTHRQASAAYADRVFLVRPGSDGALALGMLHLLVRENLVDRAYLARETLGWDELERQVLPEHPPERTAALTGLSVEDVVFLAREYGTARAPFIRLGGAPSRYGNGGLNTRAMICLPTAVGAWAKKGGGFLSSTNSGGAFDLRTFVRSDLLPGRTRIVNMNQLGHALNELDGPRVMALFVASSNPAAVCPDQNAVLKGLCREDLFTVVHERFMTDTALHADVVLPAPTMLETADLYRAYGHFYAQRVRPVVPPLGESRSNWDTIQALAKALGLTDDVFQLSADEHIDLILSRPTPWMEGVDLDALNAGHAVRLNVPRGKWLTPSGKIENPERTSPRAASAVPPDALGPRRGRAAAPSPDRAGALSAELVVHRASGAVEEAGATDAPAVSRRRGGPGADQRPACHRLQLAGRGLVRARGHRCGSARNRGRRGRALAPAGQRAQRERADLAAAGRYGRRQHVLRQPDRGAGRSSIS